MDGVDTSMTHSTEQESGREDNEQEEEIEMLQNNEEDSFQEMEIPGFFELSDDGYLSPAPEQLKTPKSSRSATSSRNTAILLEVKESIQESLKKLTEKEEKEDEFVDKLIKGQSQLLKEMTNNFIEGISSLFRRRKRKYYSSSTESESEDEKRKKK